MRVLVIGCGYIGLPLGRTLAQEGHAVVGVRRSALARAELEAAGIQPVVADITRPETLTGLPPAFDWVINCVASSRGGGVEEYRKVYLEGARHLIEWLAKSPPRRFVYTGSTGVYGQTGGADATETSAAAPGSETGRVLAETEQALLEAHRASGFPAIILRLAGIYGPGRGYWLRQFLAGQAMLEGEGDRILNMIHRDDVIGAIRAALERGEPGQVYNVADNEPVPQRELFRWLADALDRPMPERAPLTGASTRKRGPSSKRVSNRRLREELGYVLKYPTFREGFAAELADSGRATT